MSETEVAKRAARRLAIIRHAEEVSGSVARTCRYYGISRSCFYKWRERYEEFGAEVCATGQSDLTPARGRPSRR